MFEVWLLYQKLRISWFFAHQLMSLVHSLALEREVWIVQLIGLAQFHTQLSFSEIRKENIVKNGCKCTHCTFTTFVPTQRAEELHIKVTHLVV